MDTKKLAIITDAIKLGSFSKAAEKHGYTAPALIYIADGIENELGVKLINRDSLGVRPTKEGELLIPRLEALCKLTEDIKNEAAALSERKRKVTIGCYSSVAKSFIVNKLLEIRQSLSDLEVAVVVKDSIAEMQEFGADIFLVSERECANRDYTHLYTVDYVAVVNSVWFENKESVTAQDFCGYPFIMPRESAVKKAFSALNCEIISINADDDSTIIEMVRGGIGNTVLTRRAVGANESGIKILPISPEIKSEIVLTYDKKTKDIERVVKAILKD